MQKRILIQRNRLDAATAPEQMNLPGFDFHILKEFVPTRYTCPREWSVVHRV
jgi:toxin HigB-1